MTKSTGTAQRARRPIEPAAATSDAAKTVNVDESWRSTACMPLKAAAHVAGVSPASLYALEQKGALTFRRIAGRTVVVTASLAALVDNAPSWTPSPTAGAAARAQRLEAARTNWRDTPEHETAA